MNYTVKIQKYLLLTGIIIVIISPFNQLFATLTKTFTYSVDDLSLSLDTDQVYDVVDLPGAVKIGEEGHPNLPYYTYQFIIPNNMDVSSVQITSSNSTCVDSTAFIYPTQQPIPLLIGATPPQFISPDTAIYNSANAYPGDLAKCTRIGFFDGCNKIATIAVYPTQYQPADSILLLYTSISITVQLTGSSDQATFPDNRSSWGINQYKNELESMVINPEDIEDMDYANVCNDRNQQIPNIAFYPYTIITSEALEPHWSQFAEWQTMKGISAGVVTVEDICLVFSDGDEISGIEDDAGSIRQYLYYGWLNCGLVYALLGGD